MKSNGSLEIKGLYGLPEGLEGYIDDIGSKVVACLAGELAKADLKPLLALNGIYEQREEDTFMMRVRISGGVPLKEQVDEISRLAIEYTGNALHITTRQDIQLHGVRMGDIPSMMRRLKGVGLSTIGGGGNAVRNITCPVLSGLAASEIFDVTPIAHELTGFMLGRHEEFFKLPRKFKICLAGESQYAGMARMNDIGFVAKVRDGEPGFTVYAGGGMGAKSRVGDLFIDWIPVRDTLRVAEAMRRVFDKHGDRTNRARARLRYVFERLGLEEVLNIFNAELGALSHDDAPDCLSRPEFNPDSSRDPVWPTSRLSGKRTVCHIIQKQPGLAAVRLNVPAGLMSGEDLLLISQAAHDFTVKYGLRTSQDQSLVVANVPIGRLDELVGQLESAGLGHYLDLPAVSVVSCTGPGICRLGICDSRAVAALCVSAVEKAGISANVDIRVSGCPNACSCHPVAGIGFCGVMKRLESEAVQCFRVFVSASADNRDTALGTEIGTIPSANIVQYLLSALGDFRDNKLSPDEKFPAYVSRRGIGHFEKQIAKFAHVG